MSFVLKHISVAKALALLAFACVAPFVSLANPFTHWAWLTFAALAILIAVLEVAHTRTQNVAPEEKVRQYLLDFDGWKKTDNVEHYVADPQFNIREVESDVPLEFQQEWTRGEIGRLYGHGNAAFYLGVFHGSTLLQKIHIVLFDGGKKIAVSPDWSAIGKGRIYYYVADSIKYAYQRFLTQERMTDHSKGINNPVGSGSIDIPVFESKSELEKFISQYRNEPVGSTSDEEEQNRLFIENLEKYRCFKEGWAV